MTEWIDGMKFGDVRVDEARLHLFEAYDDMLEEWKTNGTNGCMLRLAKFIKLFEEECDYELERLVMRNDASLTDCIIEKFKTMARMELITDSCSKSCMERSLDGFPRCLIEICSIVKIHMMKMNVEVAKNNR